MFDSATYQRRRQALRNKVQNGIILILGNNEAPANYPDNTYKFRQDSSFLYFFGHSHPGYAGVIDIEAGEDYFFGFCGLGPYRVLKNWLHKYVFRKVFLSPS